MNLEKVFNTSTTQKNVCTQKQIHIYISAGFAPNLKLLIINNINKNVYGGRLHDSIPSNLRYYICYLKTRHF